MKVVMAACMFLSVAPAALAGHAPAHKALPAEGGVCVKGRTLIAHAAYLPQAITPGKCAQLLSTDTIMTPKHWNRT